METLYAFTDMGGIGTTLPLVIMMFFLAKSMRLKAIGRATVVPSIFNINEPLMFGAPVVFNPFFMIPMWIVSIVIPSITYWALYLGWVSIPSKTFFALVCTDAHFIIFGYSRLESYYFSHYIIRCCVYYLLPIFQSIRYSRKEERI